MLNIIIFGPPGSGKGTQSEKLISEFGLIHLSTGDLLRAEIYSKSPLGKTAASYICRGELVPDQIIIGVLEQKIEELKEANGIIYDGFPRTVDQARALKEMLSRRQEVIHVMLNLEVRRDELVERLLMRGKTSGRSDDNLETIEKRIWVYENQTKPVIDYYRSEGCYEGINGVGSIDDIFERIRKAIKKRVKPGSRLTI